MGIFEKTVRKAFGLFCILFFVSACKQIIPNADTLELINDTGINVTVTFSPEGGTWQDGTTDKIKKVGNSGSPLSSPKAPEKDGLIFTGWNTEGGTIPANFPAHSTVYNALYRPLGSDEAFYTIEYLHEKPDGSDFELYERCKKSGKTGTPPVYEIKVFAGFDYAPLHSVIPAQINADGNTKVELKYTRKNINLSLDLDGGTMNPPTAPTVLSGKFGAAVPNVNNPTKPGFDFTGWNTEGAPLPPTFPEKDKTYKALWEKGNIIVNADFSQTVSPSGDYAAYWKTQSPAHWTAKGNKNITGVEFKDENAAFSVTAGPTQFASVGGITQTIVLPDTTDGATYTLSLKMTIEKKGSGNGGGGEVRLSGKSVLKKYSGSHELNNKITVKGTNAEFTNGSGETVNVPLNGTAHNELELALFSNGIKNLSVIFSDIKCIQE